MLPRLRETWASDNKVADGQSFEEYIEKMKLVRGEVRDKILVLISECLRI